MNTDNAKVLLHCHSEYSVRDASMSIKELVDTAKSLQAEAVALTDHGNMVGVYEFADACKEAGIKPIFGVEAYYCENKDSKEKSHLILMAKNANGYRAIIKAVTDSQEFIYDDFPRMTDDILYRYFSKGKIGYRNVIATSACVNGVIAAKLRANDSLQREIDRIERSRFKMAEKGVDIDDFLNMKYEYEAYAQEVNALAEECASVKERASIKLAGIRRRLKTLSGEEAESLKKELEEKEAIKEAAEKELPELKSKLAGKRRHLSELKKQYQTQESKTVKWIEAGEKIEKIKGEFLPKDILFESAEKRAFKFKEIFEGDFYIELQNHGIASEAEIMPQLVEIAKKVNLPILAANDAHYATNSQDDIRRRDLIATLRYPDQVLDESVTRAEGHGELYLKTDLELKSALFGILPVDIVEEALENTHKIADICSYVPTFQEHYPKFKTENNETAEERLKRLAKEGIAKRYPHSWDEGKQKRLDYELETIIGLGYADYLCIVEDYLSYGRSLIKTEFEEQVGYTIGPGRGSAAGSLVCYLLGITSLDPLKYGLLFERFLNKDRVSMPDVDADFHTQLRAKVIEYLRKKYGEKAICGIITKNRMAGRSAIRNVGRITEVPAGLTDTVARTIPAIPNAKIADGGKALEEMCQKNPTVAKLVKDALLVEGRMSAYSSHAAGIIIADNGDVSDYVPMMKTEIGNVTQCDMEQCESKAGQLKMDFLGLRNLDIITDTLRRVYRNYGIRIEIEKVDFEAAVFAKIFAAGKTNSVFQFESNGMKSMLRQFRPDCFEDLILLVAAYRPGPMQNLEDIIAIKHKRKKPVYICNGMEAILKDTYGNPVYQEQIMQICHQVAGFTLGEADIIRKAMGKKKLNILTDPKTNYAGKFIDGLVRAGATRQAALEYWDELLKFGSYAFNKSHAAAYALLSYYTAWLKYHYPAEYMCAVMARTDSKKLPLLLEECKAMGISVLPPDINLSDVDFSNENNPKEILFGFNNIKGVGNAGTHIVEMRKEGRFVSVRNFVYRITSGKGQPSKNIGKSVFEVIVKCGGFDSFCDGNRTAILYKIEELCDAAKKVKDKEVDIILKEQEWKDAQNEKERVKKERSYLKAKESLARYRAVFDSIILTEQEESKKQRLQDEKELMGLYISGHPLDDYEQAIAEEHVQKISELEDGRCSICGIISKLTFKTTKKDGKPIAFFTLSDKSGECEIKCWSKEFELYSSLLREENVVKIDGKAIIETANDENGFVTTVGTAVHVRAIKQLQVRESKMILLTCDSIMDWQDRYYDKLKPYMNPSGCVCCLNDKLFREVRKCTFRISKDILEANIPGLSVSII